MYKKIIIQKGKSYFKKQDDKIYDLTRDNSITIKLFGITIYEKRNIITDSEIINLDSNKVGFQNK